MKRIYMLLMILVIVLVYLTSCDGGNGAGVQPKGSDIVMCTITQGNQEWTTFTMPEEKCEPGIGCSVEFYELSEKVTVRGSYSVACTGGK